MASNRVLVVGAGPAGVSCAAHLAERGIPVALVDQRNAIGGQVNDYTGQTISDISPPMRASELLETMNRPIRHFIENGSVRLYLGVRIERLWIEKGFVQIRGETALSAERFALAVLATGARPRGMEHHNPALGVLVGAGDRMDRCDTRGKRVAILGGGDNAFENAVRVMRSGARNVVIYSRSTPRAKQYWQEAARDHGVRVVQAHYMVHQNCVTSHGETQRFDNIFVLWGYDPSRELFDKLLNQDRVILIGDASRADHDRSIAAAQSDGIQAARQIVSRNCTSQT